jgi:branched-chain amino acid transport system permease protein
MELLLTRLLDGVNNGVIYGFLALALVCTYRGGKALNLAQGEMAMFCTFVAYELVHLGTPVIVAVLAAGLVGAAAGGVVERFLVRPFGRHAEYSVLLVTIGLFLAVNAAAGVIWGGDPKAFPSLVPDQPSDYLSILGARLHYQQLVLMAVLAVLVGLVYSLFLFTRVGLAMRVVQSNPETALLLGIRVSRVNSLGWALAGSIGGLLGPLIAPATTVTTTMFFSYVIYACAAATLGGFDNPIGAVVGGVVIGVVENLVAGYVSFVGDSLKLTVALVILLAVLMVRPHGILGSPQVERV